MACHVLPGAVELNVTIRWSKSYYVARKHGGMEARFAFEAQPGRAYAAVFHVKESSAKLNFAGQDLNHGGTGDGIPWTVNVRVDWAVFQSQGNFAEFIAQLVPYTMVGRYQIMCRVPAGEWSVRVTIRDAETGEVLAEDHESPYYEGVYEVYYGQGAMDKATSLTEYGLTMEELEQVLSANMNGYIPGGSKPSDLLYAMGDLEDDRERYQVCLDTFYAVILHNQRLVSSPEEVREGGNSTLYLGFYLPELEMADLTNCNASSNTQRTFQKKTA